MGAVKDLGLEIDQFAESLDQQRKEPTMTPQPVHENALGWHKGLPILKQSAQISKGARVLSQTMDVAPFEVDPGGRVYLSLLVVQMKERYDNVESKDEPGKLMGYERVVIFDALGAVPDERAGTAKAVESMMARVADKAEKDAAEKKGQFRLKGVEPVPAEDDEDEAGKVREIRSGVPDDEGASEAGGE